jgi:hypothetical protein
MLIFHRWSRQAGSLFRPFRFKVLLSVSNVLAHVWSVQTIQEFVGSSCLVFEVSPRSLDQSDLSSFLVVVWARHPDLIPTEVGCSVPEPVEPFVEAEPPLFLRAEEIIHSSSNLLHFQALIRTIEVHGLNPPESSDDDDGRSPSSDSSEEDYPGYDPGRGSSQPWPRVSRSATGINSAREPWPSLPSASSKVWNSAKKVAGRPTAASTGVSGWRGVSPCLEAVLGVAVRQARREQGGMATPHAAASKGPTPGTRPISFQQRTQTTVGKAASLQELSSRGRKTPHEPFCAEVSLDQPSLSKVVSMPDSHACLPEPLIPRDDFDCSVLPHTTAPDRLWDPMWDEAAMQQRPLAPTIASHPL